MLYDPKWKHLSIENLIAWLEKQSPSTKYKYTDPYNCLIAQWSGKIINSLEVQKLFGGHGDYVVLGGKQTFGAEQTFGAALRRARKVARRAQKVASA